MPLLLALTVALLTKVVVWSANFTTSNDADAIIPILMSTLKWDVFYWEQNRLGALVPLLAMPFRNPYGNYLVQCSIHAASALAFLFLFPVLLLRSWERGALLGGLSVAFFLTTGVPQEVSRFFGPAYPYGISILLFCLALSLFQAQRHVVASYSLGWCVLLICLWVNISLVAFALPLAAGLWFIRRQSGSASVALATGFSFLANLAYSRLATPYLTTSLRPVSLTRIPRALGDTISSVPLAVQVLILAGGISGVTTWILNRRRPSVRREVAELMVVLLAVGWLTLSLSMFRHVADYGCQARYFMLSAAIASMAGIGLLMAPLSQWIQSRALHQQIACVFGILAAVSSVLWRYPLSSSDTPRTVLNGRWGGFTACIHDNGVRICTGDFYRVWPAVFHANWQRYETGKGSEVYGITERADPTRALWAPFVREGSSVIVFHPQREPDPLAELNDYSDGHWGLQTTRNIDTATFLGKLSKK